MTGIPPDDGTRLPPPAELETLLAGCLLADRFRLRRDAERLRGQPADAAARARWHERLRQSQTRRALRLATLPVPAYDDSLPVCARRDEIRALIAQHPVVVVAGETGSGKTTQLPKILLELGRGVDGLIGHTQPRRLAARAVATRIARELGTAVGAGVGYQVRFSDQVGEHSHIKLMTDGILLAEIARDRLLEKYDALIIDEAHERSLNIDFLLGYLRRILPKRPDLRIVITSATIDHARFAKHFAAVTGRDVPVIEVSGRTYPVTTLYRPPADAAGGKAAADERLLGLPQAVDRVLAEIQAIERAQGRPPAGDVLVFCTGEREIRELHAHLKKSQRGADLLPLYARLGAAEQNRVFAPDGSRRRIVLATNVAETSVTVPGIGYVIDPGLVRISRYSARSRVQRLPIEPVSQASANQRAGRCGRIAAGTCFRLYEEADFLARPAYTDPEIRRTNLASVILQMLALGLGDIEEFPFIDPPERRYVQDGWKLLQELGAVDAARQLTATGRQLARLPVDPRLGRMLLEAVRFNALAEVLVIVSALAVQDPRERPHDRQQAADEAHAVFNDRDSDFLWFLHAWRAFDGQRQVLGSGELKRWCERHFLSFLRLREWRETHRQLHLVAGELGLRENGAPADFTAIHKALLSGLLGQVFRRDDERDAASGLYVGTHGRRFALWPGSVHAAKGVAWGAAAELLETHRAYARTVARVQPGWIEGQAKHLLRRDYFDVQWQRDKGMVMAREQVSLYGLVLHPGREVHYGPIEPSLARELFIRGALVNGDWEADFPFMARNAAVAAEVERLEAKLRRRDVRVDDDVLYAWFADRLPADVYSAQKFAAWYRAARQADPDLLCFSAAELMARTPEGAATAGFPDRTALAARPLPAGQAGDVAGGATFAVDYRFAPGDPADGATLVVPLAVLNQVQAAQLDWLVPGLLRERCIALAKSLPKELRRGLVPVPETIDGILPQLRAAAGERPLAEALAAELRRVSGQNIRATDFNAAAVPPHLLPAVRVLDAGGAILAESRDPVALRQQLGPQAMQAVVAADAAVEIRDGDFAALPLQAGHRAGDLLLHSYPALVDAGDRCRVQAFADADTARTEHRRGLRRLFLLHGAAVIRPLRRALSGFNEAAVAYRAFGSSDELLDDLWLAVADLTFLRDERAAGDVVDLLRDGAAFRARWETGRPALHANANRLLKAVVDTLARARDVRQRLAGLPAALAASRHDIGQQLDALLVPRFVSAVPAEWLTEFPRYLQAMQARLDKLPGQPERDRAAAGELRALVDDEQALRARLQAEGRQSIELDRYRWMIEEYRVSLFAQTLGTRMPVSAQRLAKQRARIA
ncbi:MAG: ATP-dependent RNA helicase HrpA [Pseudomonadota bacterium]